MYKISKSSWDYYLQGHRHKANRGLHFAGWILLLVCLAIGACSRSWVMVVAGIAGSYALAWLGHFAFERNTPESFRRPLFSALASLRLFVSMLFCRPDR